MPSLLDLAAEVRIIIYKHLFTGSKIIVQAIGDRPPRRPRYLAETALLTTCHLLRNESLFVLTAATTLVIKPGNRAVHVQQLIPARVLSSIQHASLVADEDCHLQFSFHCLPALKLLNVVMTGWTSRHWPEGYEPVGVDSNLLSDEDLFRSEVSWRGLRDICSQKPSSVKVVCYCVFECLRFSKLWEVVDLSTTFGLVVRWTPVNLCCWANVHSGSRCRG